jgi:hypothetical protein
MKSPEIISPLRSRYFVPPFSVLSAEAGYWKAENQKWRDWGLIFDPRPENFVLDTGELETFEPNCNTLLEAHMRLRTQLKTFCVVPTTIWSARGGYWRKVKRHWIYAIGLRGERGRSEIATAYNICSAKWGRGVKLDDNPDRVLGVGLSGGQDRINKALEKYNGQSRIPKAVPDSLNRKGHYGIADARGN